jgi:hypothetical protein
MRRMDLVAVLVWSIPTGVLGQLLLAGLSLFHDAGLWIAHGVLGFTLMLPIGAVALLAFLRPGLAHLRAGAVLVALAYAAQITLILTAESIGSGIIQALHAANAGLVLLSSFALAQKERDRAAGRA